jgi:hypothetical protein
LCASLFSHTSKTQIDVSSDISSFTIYNQQPSISPTTPAVWVKISINSRLFPSLATNLPCIPNNFFRFFSSAAVFHAHIPIIFNRRPAVNQDRAAGGAALPSYAYRLTFMGWITRLCGPHHLRGNPKLKSNHSNQFQYNSSALTDK